MGGRARLVELRLFPTIPEVNTRATYPSTHACLFGQLGLAASAGRFIGPEKLRVFQGIKYRTNATWPRPSVASTQ
jgi:hypothetical protein